MLLNEFANFYGVRAKLRIFMGSEAKPPSEVCKVINANFFGVGVKVRIFLGLLALF